MISIVQHFPVIIVANGAFPEHPVPLTLLKKAEKIISCDGATEALLLSGFEPDYIVGDLDSLSSGLREHYAGRLRHSSDQETNDLTKAVRFAVENGWNRIGIIGATGKREDHTLGNISLLADYMDYAEVRMFTDYGVFTPIKESAVFESFPGQQVSLFSLTPETVLESAFLKYPLNGMSFSSWWQGTLNEAERGYFEIQLNRGEIIVFRTFPGC